MRSYSSWAPPSKRAMRCSRASSRWGVCVATMRDPRAKPAPATTALRSFVQRPEFRNRGRPHFQQRSRTPARAAPVFCNAWLNDAARLAMGFQRLRPPLSRLILRPTTPVRKRQDRGWFAHLFVHARRLRPRPAHPPLRPGVGMLFSNAPALAARTANLRAVPPSVVTTLPLAVMTYPTR